MAVSVTKTVEESYVLIKGHYKEVIVPLIILLLFAAAGQGARFLSPSSSSSGSSQIQQSTLTNAMAGSGALLAKIAPFLLIIIAVILVIALVVAILDRAIWFYVYEHFHALLTKKKLAAGWKARMKRNIWKSLALLLFNLALFAVFIGIPIALSLLVLGVNLSGGFSALLPLIALLAIFIIALLIISFFIIPLWVYYAMDNLPFFTSISRSFSLVEGNVWTFLKFIGIFFILGAVSVIVIIISCCFSFITAPILMVGLQLLSGVTLMSLKQKIEKEKKKK